MEEKSLRQIVACGPGMSQSLPAYTSIQHSRLNVCLPLQCNTIEETDEEQALWTRMRPCRHTPLVSRIVFTTSSLNQPTSFNFRIYSNLPLPHLIQTRKIQWLKWARKSLKSKCRVQLTMLGGMRDQMVPCWCYNAAGSSS